MNSYQVGDTVFVPMLTGVGQILGASRQLVVMEDEVEDCGNLGLKQVY